MVEKQENYCKLCTLIWKAVSLHGTACEILILTLILTFLEKNAQMDLCKYAGSLELIGGSRGGGTRGPDHKPGIYAEGFIVFVFLFIRSLVCSDFHALHW